MIERHYQTTWMSVFGLNILMMILCPVVSADCLNPCVPTIGFSGVPSYFYFLPVSLGNGNRYFWIYFSCYYNNPRSSSASYWFLYIVYALCSWINVNIFHISIELIMQFIFAWWRHTYQRSSKLSNAWYLAWPLVVYFLWSFLVARSN